MTVKARDKVKASAIAAARVTAAARAVAAPTAPPENSGLPRTVRFQSATSGAARSRRSTKLVHPGRLS